MKLALFLLIIKFFIIKCKTKQCEYKYIAKINNKQINIHISLCISHENNLRKKFVMHHNS